MSVNNKTINKNKQGSNLAKQTTTSPIAAESPAGAGQPFVVLDDLAPPALPSGSLTSNDLKVLHAMQSILEKRQNDAWIEDMRAQITSELEWDEA
jgi:hypothetical protein